MIATPTKPPTVKVPKTGRTIRKYYTIHSFPNSVMAVKLHDHEHVNTSVISFSVQTDAMFMGRMIENHRAKTKEWPIFNFADLQNDNMFRVMNYTGDAMSLDGNLYLEEWTELDDLKLYCASHFLDLITLNRLTQSEDGFVMKGNIFRFEADQQFCTQRLEYLYDKFE